MVEISIPYLKKLAVFFLATCITCVADSANLAQLPSLPPSPPPKSLKLKSKGENVKIIQTKLKKLGYYQDKVNGIYGETTKVAVIAFQKSVNLKPTGITDANTWTKLQTTQPKKSDEKPKKKQPVASNDKFFTKKRILWLGLGIISVGAGVWLVIFIIRRSASILNNDDLPPLPVNKSVENQGNIYNNLVIQDQNNNSLNSPQNNENIAPEINVLPPSSGELTSELDSDPLVNPTPNHNPVTEHQTTLDALYLLELLSVLEKNVSIPANDISDIASNTVQKIDPVEELITSLASNQPSQRRKAIWELAQTGDSRAIQPLVNLMIQSDSQQTSLILEAISQISIRTLKPINRALISSFQHNNPDVRKNAIRDVTRIYELIHQVYQILRNAVNDPDEDVQETAKWAINKLLPVRRNKPPDNK